MAAPLGSLALTLLVSASADDSNVLLPALPFPFYVSGTNYASSMYVGSNSYITFGLGFNVYSSLSATTPGRALLIQGADNSYQRVYAGSEFVNGNTRYRIRFEGTAGTSGTVGAPTMVWEVSFYSNNRILVTIGAMARTGGAAGLSNGAAFVAAPPMLAGGSYLITTADGGNTWAFTTGSQVIA